MVAGAVCLLVGAACDDEPRREPAIDRGAAARPKPPLVELAIGAVKRATVAAVRLQSTPSKRDHYLDLRREIALALPYVEALRGGIALVGSAGDQGDERHAADGAATEGAALERLDAALEADDAAARGVHLTAVLGALRLLDHELTLDGVSPEGALRALSDATFELGLRLAEANRGAPARPDAVLADLQGLARSIHLGVETVDLAYGKRPALAEPRDAALRALAPIEAALAAVDDAHGLARRADLIRATGPLGAALRRLAAAAGVAVELPYPVRHPVAGNEAAEPVTVLTLPAAPHEAKAAAGGQSRLDRFARGIGELTAADHAGFDLFVGKARCSRCHLPPSFGGRRPPTFGGLRRVDLRVREDPGAGPPAASSGPPPSVPSLRNAALTAPHFHHAGFPELDEGAVARTPALTAGERATLKAFLTATLRDEGSLEP